MGVIGRFRGPHKHRPTDDESKLIHAYAVALNRLALEGPMYGPNLRAWVRWSNAQRLAWIYWLEEQAEKGLPIAVALVTQVTINKVTS